MRFLGVLLVVLGLALALGSSAQDYAWQFGVVLGAMVASGGYGLIVMERGT